MAAIDQNDTRDLALYARRCGLPIGLLLSLELLFTLYSDLQPLLWIPALVIIILMPIVTYRLQRDYFRAKSGLPGLSSLWSMGVMFWALGSLIATFTAFVVLQWLRPGLIIDQLQMAASLFRSTPDRELAEIARLIDASVKNYDLPRPIDVSMNIFCLQTFCGSLLSLVTATLVRIVGLRKFRNE